MNSETENKNCFDAKKCKAQFPVLRQVIAMKEIVYLDTAATSQKPQQVIDRMTRFYEEEYATINRGVYKLSQNATLLASQVREQCKQFVNAASTAEIIFTRGTTEAINLVAKSWGSQNLSAADCILISELEHHANIVPWQLLQKEKGFRIHVIPAKDNGDLCLESYKTLLSEHKPKLVCVGHVSNALGTVHPIKKMIALAHAENAFVLIDDAQAVPHFEVDVQNLDADFYAFSAHKMYGPSGIGILYGKKNILDEMPPFMGGGDMIESVSFEKTTFARTPFKFEAGTPSLAEIVGLGAAIDYLHKLGLKNIKTYEDYLLQFALSKLSDIPGLNILANPNERSSLVSFVLDGIHPHDIGTILDEEGISVRAGHHCAQPTMKRYGVPATVRATFAHYNTEEDVQKLVLALKKVKEVFG